MAAGAPTCFQLRGTEPAACEPSDALPMVSSPRSRLSRSGAAPVAPPEPPIFSSLRLKGAAIGRQRRLARQRRAGQAGWMGAAEGSSAAAYDGGSPRSASLRTGGTRPPRLLGSSRGATATTPPQRTGSTRMTASTGQPGLRAAHVALRHRVAVVWLWLQASRLPLLLLRTLQIMLQIRIPPPYL